MRYRQTTKGTNIDQQRYNYSVPSNMDSDLPLLLLLLLPLLFPTSVLVGVGADVSGTGSNTGFGGAIIAFAVPFVFHDVHLLDRVTVLISRKL